MLVVKDAMVLIHLSKLTLLEASCKLFRKVLIPDLVYREAVERGKNKGYEDAVLVEEFVENNLIGVRDVKNSGLVNRARKFNIQGGEAEAVALYWQESADFLATDDDNVREKRTLLELDLVSTPVIIWKLLKDDKISEEKFVESLENLREIGWFSNTVIDKILEKGKKNA